MRKIDRLIKIRGKQVELFIKAVKTVRPGITISSVQWNGLSAERRRAKIASFLELNGFTIEEKRKIADEVFKLRIPWKLIGILFIIALIVTTGFLYNRFLDCARVFAIGSDVPVFNSASDPVVVKKINLFGKSNSGTSTASSMIMLKEKPDGYVVSNDNFLDWLFSKKEFYVSKEATVLSRDEYDSYVEIFRAAKGLSIFGQIGTQDRKAIKSFIDKENTLFKSELVVSTDTTGEYQPFLVVKGMDDQYHIFICLKKQDGSFYNLKITHRAGIPSEGKEVATTSGRTFNLPLLWRQEQTPQYSVVYFFNVSSKEVFRSLYPPYEVFVKP